MRSALNAFGERLLLLGLFALPLLMDGLAQIPYYNLSTPLYPATLFAAIIIALFLLLLLFVTPSRALLNTLGNRWQRRGILLLCLLPALLTLRFMGGVPSLPVRILFSAFAVIFFVLWIKNPASLLWFFILALAYSFIQRFRFLNIVPIDLNFSDILPLITLAGQNFLAGHPVYVTYHVPWSLPLAYLPITWLSYVPALALGLDLRWINLAAQFGIALIFLALVYSARHMPAANVAFGLGALIFLLPTSIYWDAFTSHQIWWFWLALSVYFLIRQRWVGWSVASGIALAASQLSIVVLPIMALYLVRAVSLKRAFLYLAILAGVVMLIFLPFVIQTPENFLNYNIFFFSNLANYGRVLWENNQRVLNVIGFGGTAWLRGWQDVFKYIQAALLLLLTTSYAFLFRNSIVNVLRVMTVTLGLFLLASPIIWEYYYQAVFYLLLFFVTMVVIQQETNGV